MPGSPEANVIDALKRFPAVRRVWLFGSRARGDHQPRADIDLAVEGDMGISEWLDIVEAVDASTLYKTDIVRLEEQSGSFRQAILDEGRIIYERH